MGGEKDASRGGFFQLFDWTAKSRKKLFSSKSELPERSKQGKKSHGNLPMTRFNLVDEDDIGAGSSVRGGSDYSCASSVTDEEGYGSRAPNVVARLMGLDSLPTSSCSNPFFDTQSLDDVHYHRRRDLDNLYDNQSVCSGNVLNKGDGLVVEPKPRKIIIEKFQTEMLPPKSAKSIPVTQHKLLSPIKSHAYIPAKNAAHIMEAATRIIEARTHAPVKEKKPLVGSSSAPIKVRDLKEKVEATQKMHVPKGKVEATQKPSRHDELSRRTSDSKYLKEQPLNKGWNGAAETISVKPSLDNEESSKNKGKSISLAIQAKVNVQKREGLHTNGSKSFGGLKEDREVKSTLPFKNQPSVQKNLHKKSSTHTASTVLRQNNQKQNSLPGKDKLPSKPPGRKGQSVDPSCGGTRTISSKSVGSSRTGSRKLGLGEMDNEKEVLYSGTKNHPRKKRSIGSEFSYDKSQGVMEKSQKPNQSNTFTDRHLNMIEDSRTKGMDVVSFTFTAPLTRAGSSTTTPCQGKKGMIDSDYTKLSSLGYNVIGGDALSALLEKKLEELSYGAEYSCQNSAKLGSAPGSYLNMHDLVLARDVTQSLDGVRNQHARHADELSGEYDTEYSFTEPMLEFKQNYQGADMMNGRINNHHMEARKFFDFQHTSPVSVLQTKSCNFSDSVDSNSPQESKLASSSIQAQYALGLNKFHSADTELSDSASSTAIRTMINKPETTPIRTYLARSDDYELDYVNDILCNIDLMFYDFSLGQSQFVINPRLFDELESQKVGIERGEHGRLERKVLFNCVSECVRLRCTQCAGGGCKAWTKGAEMVKRKESLAEEVLKEIRGWRGMGDKMVDEVVDKDMSNQYGRWLDYQVDGFHIGAEVESHIFNSLLEEVFDVDVLAQHLKLIL